MKSFDYEYNDSKANRENYDADDDCLKELHNCINTKARR
jgi:hypothetical protein